MPAAVFNITVEQGADFEFTFWWKSRANGLPVSLSGATARMQVRSSPDATAVLADSSTDNGLIVLGGESGKISVRIPAATTRTMNFARALYDLQVTFPSGRVVRLLRGEVFLSRSVTR